jgi:hypothetical protein
MARRASKQTRTLAALAALLGACGGDLGSPLGPVGGGTGVGSSSDSANGGVGTHAEQLSFECKPDARASQPLRRLSRAEYENSLRDLIAASTSEATAAAVMQAAEGALSAVPSDAVTKHEAFGRMDQSVSQQHVEAYFNAGQSVARALVSTGERVSELLGSCASATGSAADSCIDAFVERFGKRALRRPVTDADRSFFREVYAATGSIDREALVDLITVMLAAPDFVYQVELGGEAVAGAAGLYQLTGYEIAARLSYQFWQTGPDDTLLAAADSGELGTDAGFEAALDHVLASPRASATLERFAREWFGLNSLRAMDSLVGDPVFDAFAGDLVPSPDLTEDMIKELTESLSYHAFSRADSLRDWVQSPYSFARTEELASIYGTPVWSGEGEPPTFPDGERAGLITRAALLATGSATTRPIMKGVVIRERLLCDSLPPPPPNAGKDPPELSPELSTREVVVALTEQPGSSCAGCHTKQINPLGFATENFDALGRAREVQPLFSPDGAVVAERPLDTSSTPEVWSGDGAQSSGAHDLSALLVESGKVEACFARQFVRFAQGRKEDEAVDGCALEAIRSSLSEGESLRTALRKFALLPSFRQRLAPGDA